MRRRFRTPLVFAVALGLLAGAGTQARQDSMPTAQELVLRHVAALGGATAFKAVRSVRVRGRFEIRDRGIAGDFDLLTARPNRMLYRVTLPAVGVIETGFDGMVGWLLNPVAGPELLSGQQLAELAAEAWFDAPLFEDDHVRTIGVPERTEFDGRAAFKVRVVLRAAGEVTEYFEAASGIQIGSESIRATPQGPVPTVNILRNHRRFGALLQPTVFVQRALGFEQVVTVTSCEYDSVPESAFALPASIAALVGR